jgi:SOS-response transcriptional repressor LexA
MEKMAVVSSIKLVSSDSPEVIRNSFKNYLPVYSLKAAAGYFGSSETTEMEGWVKVENMGKLNKKMFIAQVKGKSMEPRIGDGDYCIFQANPVGSRQGKIVLAQYNGPEDPDTGGSYTIKKYHSVKESQIDNKWIHKKISLEPINKKFKPIELDVEENNVTIIAEFVGILQTPEQ